MKDLSEKRTPNTRKRVETGISKKNGTNDANIRPYGPEVTRLTVGSAKGKINVTKKVISRLILFDKYFGRTIQEIKHQRP